MILKIMPPSPQTLRIKQELSKMPPLTLNADQARAQVRIHLQEARQEMLKHGHAGLVRNSRSGD